MDENQMKKDKPVKIVDLYPPPPEKKPLTPGQLEAIRQLNEIIGCVASLGAWIRDHWSE